ncbi:MAG: fasciclin domain-containing protein [Alphaproteobacteria bacterium]|jgi:uncharacterized surface protein with fasciclin (FAS1) repeats|nr:fasciclin domain-containing protein [Alphaproteobacteria bacterium]
MTRIRSLARATLLAAPLALAGVPAQAADIVDTAVAADGFNTLVALVQQAGLVETLKGDGPFTVFAPTDEAFAAVPQETLEALQDPANRDQLVAVLTYHVVPGEMMAADVLGADTLTTVEGSELSVSMEGDQAMIGEANIVSTDIDADNGVIHVIDAVLIPPM